MIGDDICQRCQKGPLQPNNEGDIVCQNCGNTIVGTKLAEELNFGPNQQLVGEFVNINQQAYTRFGYNNERDTVQRRFDNARKKIEELRKLMNVEEEYDSAVDQAIRVIKLANEHDFFGKGKNMDNYSAAAYYIALRLRQAPYLLYDFSDKLNVPFYKLARCFLRLIQKIKFQMQLPLIQPSLFITRYCRMLDFPHKTRQIAHTARQLVKRMQRDWMSHGRRPSSLCGAAILIASKIHDVPCTTREICNKVFVCDETIKRRLDEFKQTKTAKLTREEFERMEENLDDLEGEEDPPAFSKARMKSMNTKLKDRVEQQSERDLEEFEQAEKSAKDDQSRDQADSSSLNLNIPNQIINQQADQIEVEMKRVESIHSHRTDEVKGIVEVEAVKRPRQYLNEKETLSDISDGEVERFLLSEDEQRMKKKMWQQLNKKWIEKQDYREENANRVIIRRQKRQKEEPGKADTAFEAITTSKLADKNIILTELKKLLAGKPEMQEQKKQSPKEFDAFAYKFSNELYTDK